MGRSHHVHAVATATPLVGWCPSGESSLTEEESTKKVPEYILAFARSFEDDLITDTHTMPMSAVGTNHLDALEELAGSELEAAFDSLDRLESEPPARPSVAVRHSGVVPAGSSLPIIKEVIPPPPRRPQPLRPAPTFAFAASLEAFAPSNVPFLALSDNEQVAVSPKRRAATLRANVSRSIASAVFSLCALLVLFAIGGKPIYVVLPVARTPLTMHARADRTDTSGTARARVARSVPAATALPLAPLPPPRVVVASPARFDARRAPAPSRVAKASHIIRTSPF